MRSSFLIGLDNHNSFIEKSKTKLSGLKQIFSSIKLRCEFYVFSFITYASFRFQTFTKKKSGYFLICAKVSNRVTTVKTWSEFFIQTAIQLENLMYSLFYNFLRVKNLMGAHTQVFMAFLCFFSTKVLIFVHAQI